MAGREVLVFGAGGHALVVIGAIRAAGDVPVGVYDDNRDRWNRDVLGVPVRGPVEEGVLRQLPVVIAIGDNRTRQKMSTELNVEWHTVIHPRAWLDPSVLIGAGSVVFAGAIVQPHAVIGSHAILNTSASVDHECRIGDFAQIAPGAHLGGNVQVDEGAFVGIGSAIIQGVKIGSWSTVGAGAAVIHDVAPNTTAVGVPTRVL